MPESIFKTRKALFALLLLAILWGFNWVQMKIGVYYAPPFVFAAIRILLGAVCLFLTLLWLRKPLQPKAVAGTFVAGLLQIAGVYGFAMWALVSGGAGRTSVLVYIMPFWTLVLAWLFLGERLRGWQWFAVGLSFCGLLFILEPQNLSGTFLSKLLALMAGISWGGGAIVAKKLQQSEDLDLLSFTAWQTLFAAIPLSLVALLVPAPPISWTPAFIFALVYNVIPGTAIATLLWLFILNELPAGTASLGLLLNPVVAVLAAWVQLQERPGISEAIGMACIAIALLLNAGQAMKQAKPKETEAPSLEGIE